MPRPEFSSKEEFEVWAVDHLIPEKYEIYYTNDGLVIAVPLKSTKPTVYSLINLQSKENAKNFAKELTKKYNIKSYNVNHFVWNAEREPLE